MRGAKVSFSPSTASFQSCFRLGSKMIQRKSVTLFILGSSNMSFEPKNLTSLFHRYLDFGGFVLAYLVRLSLTDAFVSSEILREWKTDRQREEREKWLRGRMRITASVTNARLILLCQKLHMIHAYPIHFIFLFSSQTLLFPSDNAMECAT